METAASPSGCSTRREEHLCNKLASAECRTGDIYTELSRECVRDQSRRQLVLDTGSESELAWASGGATHCTSRSQGSDCRIFRQLFSFGPMRNKNDPSSIIDRYKKEFRNASDAGDGGRGETAVKIDQLVVVARLLEKARSNDALLKALIGRDRGGSIGERISAKVVSRFYPTLTKASRSQYVAIVSRIWADELPADCVHDRLRKYGLTGFASKTPRRRRQTKETFSEVFSQNKPLFKKLDQGVDQGGALEGADFYLLVARRRGNSYRLYRVAEDGRSMTKAVLSVLHAQRRRQTG